MTTNPAPNPPRPVEWCDRRLLARIHRLTLDGLRRQIQPVEPVDYVRFLVHHHHLAPDQRRHGRQGLREAVRQLQGFEIAAAVWEHRVLPGRVNDYEPGLLDELAMTGELVWGRLRPPAKAAEGRSAASVTRAVAISLMRREDLSWLLPADRLEGQPPPRGNAELVLAALQSRGALFFHEIAAATDLLPGYVEEALHELVALGLITADGYAAVRSVVAGRRKRGRRLRPAALAGNGTAGRRDPAAAPAGRGGAALPAGRWSLFPGLVGPVSEADYLQHWARQLLDRWGIVFRDLLSREVAAPAWGRLLPVYRRLEARGEIRGGRFVTGVGGEQYALPAAVELIRHVRDLPAGRPPLIISAADPLNLAGIITSEPRIAATHTSTLALREGRLIASQQAGHVEFYEQLAPEEASELARGLRRLIATSPAAR